ncbi:hypothetical protein [Sphingobacterium populi]|uniref:Uncharacterized protein n=2 Tax=Sphingobacterium TaxID=28453 RepID=A0ABW5UAQ9_9SPHI
MIEDKILFPYILENQIIDHESWSENGVRIPVSKGVWLATNSLPVSVTDLFIGHSAGDIMCFCHYYPNWIIPSRMSAFASLGLLPTKEQFTWLKSLFTNARIHTVFDGGISGRIADCKVATWQFDKSTSFSLTNDHVEVHYGTKKYCIPVSIFSLNRFERFSGIRGGIRTHKPTAPFETFYESFINWVS